MIQMNIFNNETAKELKRIITSAADNTAIRAGVLSTRDRDHAMHVIREVATSMKKDLYHYTIAGRKKWDSGKFAFETCGGGTPDPAELLKSVQTIKGGAVVIIEDVLSTLNDNNGDKNARQQLYGMLSVEKRSDGTVLIFLEPPEAETHIPSMLGGSLFNLSIPMPKREELNDIALRELTVVMTAMEKTNNELAQRWSRVFATELTGLTRTAATNAIRDALALKRSDFEGARTYLASRKKRQLSHELSMEVLDDTGELPQGLEYLYRYLELNRQRISTTGKNRAKGILLVGQPGTGKTMLAKAAGRLLGLPVVEFRISSLMNSLLGATERRFDQAFQVLEAMAPNIVFIDEIEKAFGDNGSENDGGTMMRTTGRLLTWLSENPHPNFIIATSNNVARMGEIGLTMTRSGRFDKIFFVDTPSRAARQQMLDSWLKGKVKNVADVATTVAEATPLFTGADLQSIVNEATVESAYQKQELTQDVLIQEAQKKKLRVQALYENFAGLRRFAELYCERAGASENN